jgi:hypothetical protein
MKPKQGKTANGRRQRASRNTADYKMIWIKVGFHTDFGDRDQTRLTRAPKRDGKYWRAPGNCWDSGFIILPASNYNEITAHEPTPFNAIEELLPKLVSLLQAQDVVIHRRNQKIKNVAKVMTRFQGRQ